jgi:hypothetical protein
MVKTKTVAVSMLLVAASLFAVFAFPMLSVSSAPAAADNGIRFSNQICDTVIHPDGTTTQYPCVHNAILTQGRTFIRDFLILAGTKTPMYYMAFGNGTGVAASDTALNAEMVECGMTRAQGTVIILNTTAFRVQLSATNTCAASIVVNTTGLYNASSGAMMMFAGNISTPPTLAQNDQLVQNYTVNLA